MAAQAIQIQSCFRRADPADQFMLSPSSTCHSLLWACSKNKGGRWTHARNSGAPAEARRPIPVGGGIPHLVSFQVLARRWRPGGRRFRTGQRREPGAIGMTGAAAIRRLDVRDSRRYGTACLYALRWGLFLGCALAPACALPTFTDTRGPERPAAALNATCWFCSTWVTSVMDAGDGSIVWQLGKGRATRRLWLRPGKYLISYYAWDTPHRFTEVRNDAVELEGGREYTVRAKFCNAFMFKGICRGHRNTGTVWIEEKGTGKVVAGERWW